MSGILFFIFASCHPLIVKLHNAMSTLLIKFCFQTGPDLRTPCVTLMLFLRHNLHFYKTQLLHVKIYLRKVFMLLTINSLPDPEKSSWILSKFFF